MHRMNRQQGFALIELIVVIAILAILSGILVPSVIGHIDRAKLAVDQATVGVLNSATPVYRQFAEEADPFADDSNQSDELMQELVADGYLSEVPVPQTRDSLFAWDFTKEVWLLFVNDIPVALSPLGSSFDEVSSGMIGLILKRYENAGKYGRTWGDYSYTDIGLDPVDWKDPIQHIYYRPGGSTLRIRPEDGYTFIVRDITGVERKLSASYKWDLVYSDLDKKWYYHSIAKENEIDITTLAVSK